MSIEILSAAACRWRIVGSLTPEVPVQLRNLGDADQLMQTFRRNAYSSVIFRCGPSEFQNVNRA